MNRSLSEAIRRQLMPALERSQGFAGTYVRGAVALPLVAIPTEPDWEKEDDSSIIEEWVEVKFMVAASTWCFLGLGAPQQADRYTVILADGISRTYALLPPKGRRPYELSADGSTYFLRMKWVKA